MNKIATLFYIFHRESFSNLQYMVSREDTIFSALENGIYYYQVLDTYGNVETAGKLILEK